MRITLDSTTTTLELEVNGTSVPARLWEGHTEDGDPVIAFITRISPQTHDEAVAQRFAAELVETARPSLVLPSPIPLRLIL